MNILTDFQQEDCPNCHITFFVPTAFQAARMKDKKAFYCPNGHAPAYMGKTTEQVLRDRIEAKDGIIATLEADVRRLTKKPRKPRAKKP